MNKESKIRMIVREEIKKIVRNEILDTPNLQKKVRDSVFRDAQWPNMNADELEKLKNHIQKMPLPKLVHTARAFRNYYKKHPSKLEESKRVMEDNTLGLAKSAIRDIFISRASRSVSLKNWPGFRDFIVGNYGKKNYVQAMLQLKKGGWLKKKGDYFQWVQAYGPVNQNEDSAPGWSAMEITPTERDKRPQNWSHKAPTEEKSFDVYRNQKA